MPAIAIEHLRKRYGTTEAVRDVSFTVEPAEIFGILGPNGAGKTTTVECVSALRKPDSGAITVLGRDPRDRALRTLVGVQLQESRLQDNLTVREALELYAACYPKPADWRALAADLGLADRLGTRYAKLSGGQKQRLSIALALVGDPRLVILDELATGLDPRARRDTWALVAGLRERGVTVLLVTHLAEEATRLCDRVAVFDRGEIVALSTPAALAADHGDLDSAVISLTTATGTE